MKLRLVAAFALAVGLGACGSNEAAVMPDVVGQQLDVALSDIERAGFNDDVEVVGGGTFGVVDKSNWQVCEQLPAAGQDVEEPRLTVDRSCEEAEPEPEDDKDAATTTTAPETTTTTTTTTPTTTTAEVLENLTVENSPELAAILVSPDYCSDSIAAFASDFGGRTIEFDGSIATMNNHEGRDTRYDILVVPGDYSETSQTGPMFQFRDVGVLDLNLTGANIPEYVQAGNRFHFTAEVLEYQGGPCLFQLRPVATQVR